MKDGNQGELDSYYAFMEFMTERPGDDYWPARRFPKPFSVYLPYSSRTLAPISDAEEGREAGFRSADPSQSDNGGTKLNAQPVVSQKVVPNSDHAEVGVCVDSVLLKTSGVLNESEALTVAKSGNKVGINGLCMNLEGLEEEELEEDEGAEVDFPPPPPKPAVELYPRPDRSLPGDTFFRSEHEYDSEETLAHSGLVPLGAGPSSEEDAKIKKPFPLNPNFLPHSAVWPEGEIILNNEPRIDTILQGRMVADLDGELLDRLNSANAILSNSARLLTGTNRGEQVNSVTLETITGNPESVSDQPHAQQCTSFSSDCRSDTVARIYTVKSEPFDVPCDSDTDSEDSSGYQGGTTSSSDGEETSGQTNSKISASRKRKIRRKRLAEEHRPVMTRTNSVNDTAWATDGSSSSSSEDEPVDQKFLGHKEVVLERYRRRVERYKNDNLSTNPFRNEHVGELPYCALRKWGVDLTMKKLQSAHRKVRRRRVLQRAVKLRELRRNSHKGTETDGNMTIRTPWGNSPDRQFCAELIAQTNPVTLAMNHPFPWFEASDSAELLIRSQAESLAEDIAYVDGYNVTTEQINCATNDLMEEFFLSLLRLCRQRQNYTAIAGISVSDDVGIKPTGQNKKRPDSFSPGDRASAYLPVTPDTLYEDETWEHLYNEQARFEETETSEGEADEGFEDQTPLIRFGDPLEQPTDYHCAVLEAIEKIESASRSPPDKPDLYRSTANIASSSVLNRDIVHRNPGTKSPKKMSKRSAHRQQVTNERLTDIQRNLGDALSLGDSGIGSTTEDDLEAEGKDGGG